MSCSDMIIEPETARHACEIDDLHDEAFGPGRFAKTAYRLREGASSVAALSLIALDGERLVGSIRFTSIQIGGRCGALLLGPLAVFADYSGHRCGLALMGKGLALAREHGYELVLLVGDLAYYEKAGFKPVPLGQIVLPGPVDETRLLACELQGKEKKGEIGGKFAGLVTL